MDRNVSHEPGYRSKGDGPVPPMPHGESDYLGLGSRQVLARMPNLTQVDPDVDPIQNYPPMPENRVISSGVSVKILAGAAVCLALVAIVGFSLVNRKTSTETAKTPSGWQTPAPAPAADTAPRFETANNSPTWPSNPASNNTTSPWNNTATSSPWNTPANPSASVSGGSPNPSTPPTNSWNTPTEVTATANNPPMWGQAQETTANMPPSTPNATNSTVTPWNPPSSMTMPPATPSTWANQAPAANPQVSAAPTSPAVPSYNPSNGNFQNFQSAQPAPAYGTGYGQTPTGYGQTPMNGNFTTGNSPVTTAVPNAAVPSGTMASDPRTPAWSNPAPATRPQPATPSDPRWNFNNGTAAQTPYANPSQTQYPMPGQSSMTPTAPSGGYFTADSRTAVGSGAGASQAQTPATGNQTGNYGAGAMGAWNSYPSTTPAPSGVPTTTAPMSTYPASSYPTNPTTPNYPASNSGSPNTAFPATSTGTYPGLSAPVGAPPAPRYDGGASTVAPQAGAAAQPQGFYR